MKKITAYDVFQSYSLSSLIEKVNEGIEKGAQPFGPLTIENNDNGESNYFYQPMVRYVEEDGGAQ